MKTIPLRGKDGTGKVALVDDEDYELVNRYFWRVRYRERPGYRPNGPYAFTQVASEQCKPGTRQHRQRFIFMHKLITGWPVTDHINHNGLDNRRSNLRPGGGGVNQHNARPQLRGASKYKGVTWSNRHRKWHARIIVNKRKIHLGHYASEEDAARAYDAAGQRFWGSEAYLNFPKG